MRSSSSSSSTWVSSTSTPSTTLATPPPPTSSNSASLPPPAPRRPRCPRSRKEMSPAPTPTPAYFRSAAPVSTFGFQKEAVKSSWHQPGSNDKPAIEYSLHQWATLGSKQAVCWHHQRHRHASDNNGGGAVVGSSVRCLRLRVVPLATNIPSGAQKAGNGVEASGERVEGVGTLSVLPRKATHTHTHTHNILRWLGCAPAAWHCNVAVTTRALAAALPQQPRETPTTPPCCLHAQVTVASHRPTVATT
jgi:hypothetical protein